MTLSFEIFPPRKNDNVEKIYDTLEALKDLDPDFISVTFGAAGSKNSTNTLDIATLVKDKYKTKSIVHLPCIHKNKDEILQILQECKKRGLNDILALRGDEVENEKVSEDFSYASDLVKFIKQNGNFTIYGACYPEKHKNSKDFVEDIKNLKIKVDAGVSTLLTQLFFDNEDFYKFRQNCDLANINAKICAGIMPVTNKRQILKITSLCGAKIPPKFVRILDKYQDDEKAMFDAGIAYAIDQIVDLVTYGVDGIHLYTMNNAKVAIKIYDAIKSLFQREIK
ncbi:5,10-methylenetetrahydrofolate reductase [Campylobacter sputorum subsp. bubulus]|uniref:Methylenetetrahydrofolate reductase n=1 Tax=Campylobacter sputorum subsp. sputorum TaxID=32024 RepID=A0A381DGU8_9BACT|nr:methylenetetrahydrofolate reductase [NAD(P)H] [Campylobacter sputorum]ASM35002.1 5,10-methylenetetrahydrofolate reductase [Campylobacter sputorum aubsp. sputorum RM3237]KAB0581868.1 methylenetetrahydrofolate reductase [NAD(P)H] [Campylobacter sputorum subsp. sputorum]QEL05193.1 5,10-methylenetetrahydrofolate reductase [Campylobacter sputorum subsp. sputorum]SUX09607.1 5,10-methylenetetrahydrofolate reductase [Campylobacter sputorum subsp. sputorum]SUX30736.1 5,10-methylenetetrahydrofolate r